MCRVCLRHKSILPCLPPSQQGMLEPLITGRPMTSSTPYLSPSAPGYFSLLYHFIPASNTRLFLLHALHPTSMEIMGAGFPPREVYCSMNKRD
ncbi:unnamed protein product [Peniophora sp. CBMAI 1063]|nr:unnamed protein product [Peniophora sp. CBMAI 1063]